MFEDLTERQVDVYNFIRYRIQSDGFPPTVREICNGLDIKSTSTVHGILTALEEKSYIRKLSLKNRALEIIDRDDVFEFEKKKTIDVPIVGRVTAGQPILAVENIEDTFPLPVNQISSEDVFILNVQGESMIEVGILDGDQIIVKQQDTAKNGDIVVALIDDSATVKTFYKKENYIMLKPENSSMDPIIVDSCVILGKVIGLYRFF